MQTLSRGGSVPSNSPNSARAMSRAAAQAYSGWLDELGNWHYWGTLTTADEYSAPSLRRAIGKHLQRVKPNRAFWGIETGKLYGRRHAHILYEFADFDESGFYVPPARSVWQDWFGRHGRAHIDAFDPDRGAIHYVTKYVAKELSDYDLWLRTESERRRN